MGKIMVAALVLALGAGAALAQKTSETDGNADVLNSLMLKAGERCYGLSGGESGACCARYFDNLCGSEIAANAPAAATPAAASPAPAQAPAAPARGSARGAGLGGGDGPAAVLNGFVMKEVAQCRPLLPHERRECCEKLLHPNACVE